MLTVYLGLIAGLVLLFAGGEGLVRGAVSLANRLGLPPLVIGLTVVGFGTSMPELVVSLEAVFSGAGDIAVGNVIGSNTANILLILGAAALITPMSAKIAGLGRDLSVMLAVAFLVLGLAWLGGVARIAGIAMVVALLVYLAYAAWSSRGHDEDIGEEVTIRMNGWLEAAYIIGGLAALVIGGNLLISSATTIAREFGVPEAVIGLTIVAVGTSLPELATSVIAAFRKHSEVAIGNVVGSNIFNILGILGITSAVQPLAIPQSMLTFDVPVMIAASLVFAGLVLMAGRISRLAAIAFLAAYAAYTISLF